jgi:hypothetical protein
MRQKNAGHVEVLKQTEKELKNFHKYTSEMANLTICIKVDVVWNIS